MKTIKITYWASTGLISLMMAYSAYVYLSNPAINQAFTHLGFPSYFRIELALAKLAAAIVLLAPLKRSIKEWAYAGLGITFISAFIAHTASGDPLAARISPLIFMGALTLSYVMYNKLQHSANAKPVLQKA